ncbi:transporter associated domain-containing protein [Romboutsia hominis]|uniref:transporter associated domain-containing protein n=1 Tax=Romboutsia hominis TaxID=1507512 RepID=UPI00159ECD0D|nr:transporter associated domain-containing protein [Romboutsia hominis]
MLEPEPERTILQSIFKNVKDFINNIIHIITGKKENNELDNLAVDSKFELNDKVAREIMVSSKDAFLIDVNENIDTILDDISIINYSKIPVYEEYVDNIIGVLHVKDLMIEARKEGFKNIDIRKILHKPCFIPETKNVSELFNSIDSQNDNLFILIDEYGAFSGIVSMEDLICEIKGITYDKSDLHHDKIKKIDDNNFIVKGVLSVSDFNEIFNVNIEEGDYDTLNGYIINQLGKIPNENEDIQINLGKLILKLIRINKRRIEDIQISIL